MVKDLIRARLEVGGQVLFEVEDVRLEGVEGTGRRSGSGPAAGTRSWPATWSPAATASGSAATPSRRRPRQVFERAYPFAWLGVLAAVAPSSEEIVYAASDRGFALHSMRSPELTRLYLQVDPDEPIERWPDGRIWEELQARLATDDGWTLDEGEILDKGVTGMRSFVGRADALRAAVPGR